MRASRRLLRACRRPSEAERASSTSAGCSFRWARLRSWSHGAAIHTKLHTAWRTWMQCTTYVLLVAVYSRLCGARFFLGGYVTAGCGCASDAQFLHGLYSFDFEQTCSLAALLLQAEVGDYDEARHSADHLVCVCCAACMLAWLAAELTPPCAGVAAAMCCR